MSNTILLFKKYMEKDNLDIVDINYNLKVVELFYKHILLPTNKGFDNIDMYIFDEFTDRIDIFDKSLGGREKIESILSAMLLLTEFLKSERMIKGGKIAYYRKIFKNKEYYLDKYDNIKNKKNLVKDFIKEVSKNKISYVITRIIDDINVTEFLTLKNIVRVLDGELELENNNIVIKILKEIELIEEKGKGYITTKKGRALLRLDPEEKYASILYIFIYKLNWSNILGEDIASIENVLTINSIFNRENSLNVSEKHLDNSILSLSDDSIRFKLLINNINNYKFLKTVFIDMGIINVELVSNKKEYSLSRFGKDILKLLYNDNNLVAKKKIKNIEVFIKSRQIENLENEIISFIKIFGNNYSLWAYLGQIYIIKGDYNNAYSILVYSYEGSKNIKLSKRILTNIIICCRKLNFNKEEKLYEKKYNLIQKECS